MCICKHIRVCIYFDYFYPRSMKDGHYILYIIKSAWKVIRETWAQYDNHFTYQTIIILCLLVHQEGYLFSPVQLFVCLWYLLLLLLLFTYFTSVKIRSFKDSKVLPTFESCWNFQTFVITSVLYAFAHILRSLRYDLLQVC